MPGGKAVIPTAKNAVTTERASKNLMINMSLWPSIDIVDKSSVADLLYNA